ncbi:metallophosphoesterase family protein [Sphingomonas sp. LM7]|uniref:metallophosphoesterase family protein n=1 Tax=Sphingomonas sp. LM7 TaxID=1938607 RepID=UPI00209ABCB6|nr:metallophosphoesterase family protein [Sphingomonas sp. LM7]
MSALGGPPAPSGPAGARAYAIGDIHGRLDLLRELTAKIEADLAARPVDRNYIIFLGDFIDRGPDSAAVIEFLRNYRGRGSRMVFLAGNHEEFFLRVLNGETGILDNWLEYGGRECVRSYGLSPDRLTTLEEQDALETLRGAIPSDHLKFLNELSDTFRFGDYLFVHAGIRPGVALEDQSRRDLRWIREPFLSDSIDHGFVVVHGHTIVEKIVERRNRIAIDTGAYRTGVLTCLVIDAAEKTYLGTSGDNISA